MGWNRPGAKLDRARSICDALAAVRAGGTLAALMDACTRLVGSSDLVRFSLVPFLPCDADAIAAAIYDFIVCDAPTAMRVIQFTRSYPVVGSEIEYYEFANLFSYDMASQNNTVRLRAMPKTEAPGRLATFLASILFHYKACVTGGRDTFSITLLIDYVNAAGCLFGESARQRQLEHVMYVTGLAMCAVQTSPFRPPPEWP